MLFNSYVFILLFLPLTVMGYFFLNSRHPGTASHIYLLIASLVFYGYFNVLYLPLILFSIVFNYATYLLLRRDYVKSIRLFIVISAVVVNLGMLGYYKYRDFFFENINVVFGTNFALHHLILPLGISFFTFQQLSYVIDCYHGKVPAYTFVEYAIFVSYFPPLIAGPIVLHDELIPQFQDPEKRRINFDNFAPGLMAFAFGLAKKVLIADTFGKAVDWSYANVGALNSTDALLIIFAYTMQIYFDFSGYCDMANGIAKMMNITLPANFNSPYKALTIADFWKRWHMTLTRFFSNYVYIPLGGNRKGAAKTYRNMMVVFLVSGLWHGANWTFLFWGALHGIATVLCRALKNRLQRIPALINWLATFLFVNITWVFFRANSISDAFAVLRKAAQADFGMVNANIYDKFALYEFANILRIFNINWEAKFPLVFLAVFCGFALVAVTAMKNTTERMESFRPQILTGVSTTVLFLWGLLSLAGESSFLYFNF